MTEPIRLYGVSSGNGNDGVSHIFADYYVRTNEPYRLAKLALVGQFHPSVWDLVLGDADVDGEPDYTIQACLLNPLDDEDGKWSEYNGAWRLVDVCPEDKPREGRMGYDSLAEAFSADLLAKVTGE